MKYFRKDSLRMYIYIKTQAHEVNTRLCTQLASLVERIWVIGRPLR